VTRIFPTGGRGKPWSARRKRHGWLATWLQDRRRQRRANGLLSLLTDLAAYWPLNEGVTGNRYDLVAGLVLVEIQDPVGVGSGKLGNGVWCGREWDVYNDLGFGFPRALACVDENLLPAGDFTFSVWFNPTYQNWFTGFVLTLITDPDTPNQKYAFSFNHESYVVAPEVVFEAYGAGEWTGTNSMYPYVGYLGDAGLDGLVRIYTGHFVNYGVNDWLHLVATQSGTTLRVYVNGALSGQLEVPGVITPDGAPELYVGGTFWTYEADGIADEVGIWCRALSGAEVAQLYNSGNGLAHGGF
jgi:hypothetical protein